MPFVVDFVGMAERTKITDLNSQTLQFVIKLSNYFVCESLNGGPILEITLVVKRKADFLYIKTGK